ncbi:MAG: hypothetical protein M1838_005994 [Thelocarpon superellum]|nr:MAG: hypothetical protein M1838_005994 [Thelocarpon superellum]
MRTASALSSSSAALARLSHTRARPSPALYLASPISLSSLSSRHFSSTRPQLAEDPHAAAGDSPYEPPSGWLWGVPPGEKYKKEGWEDIWFYGFFGSLGLGVVAYIFKPDTA